MRGLELNHDQECNLASRSILDKWRSGEGLNNFINDDIAFNNSSHSFPSPDQSFYSESKKTLIAMEFKPAIRETKRGILTGLGQTIAYLRDKQNSASVLVIPEVIGNDDFEIGDFMKDIFKEQIFGKLPIALYSFKKYDPENVVLLCNISNDLIPGKEFDAKSTKQTYWAAFRDNYPSFNYNLLKTALEEKSFGPDRIEKIWKKFYFDFYCYPENASDTLEPLKSKLFVWDKDTPYVWAKNKKKELKKHIEQGLINYDQAIHRLKWHSSSNRQEKNKYWELIKNLPKEVKPAHNNDNDFDDQKKNKRNNLSHCKLWDNETWEVTEIGKKFISRIEEGCDPSEEMAIIHLGVGRYNELINDIKFIQEKINTNNLQQFLADLKFNFAKKGYIGLNPERATSEDRKFLQAERQIMRRFNLFSVNKNSFFFPGIGFKFNESRIEKLLNSYYEIYGEKLQEAA